MMPPYDDVQGTSAKRIRLAEFFVHASADML
jgi:hypothetical protein